jgi:hypothetical protein
MKARWAWLLVFSLFTSSLGLWLASGTRGVNAQEPTATPTATPTPTEYWHSIWDTPTPLPTRHYECCEGTPEGWGLCTPAADWMINCAQCAPVPTSALLPAYTPMPSPTPYPTYPVVTPTPTLTGTPPISGTVTPIPTVDPGSGWGPFEIADCGDPVMTPGNPAHIYYDGSFDNQQTKARWGFEALGDIYVESVIVEFHTWGNVAGAGSGARARADFGVDDPWLCGSSVSNYKCFTSGCDLFPPAGSGSWDIHDELTWNYGATVYAGEHLRVYWRQWAWDYDYVNYYVQIENVTINGYPLLATPTIAQTATLTPTITPTPVSGTYCCSVECEDPSNDPWKLLPNIEIGSGDCVTVQPYDLSVIGLSQFPGIEFCAVPLRFGEVNIVGVTLSIDVLATVAAALVALRIAWRS